MSANHDLERRVADFYQTEAPPRAPGWLLERTLASVGTTSQRHAGRPWRFPTMTSGVRLAVGTGAAAALIAVAALVLSDFPRGVDLPAAFLPASTADWSRAAIESPPGTGAISNIAAGPRGLVAVAGPDNDGKSRVLFSTDGSDWSEADVAPVRGGYVSLVATDRGFLMIDEDGARTSENGLDWRPVANNWSGDPDVGGAIIVDAVAGGPGYVAVSDHNSAWYSTDGATWAQAQTPPPPADFNRPGYPELTVDLLHVAAVGDHLVATGFVYAGDSNTSITEDIVLASRDGKTWSRVLPDIGDRAGPLELAAGPDGFLIIGGPLDGSDASTIWHSGDGEVWQTVGSNDFGSRSSGEVRIEDVAATSSGYVAVGLARDCIGCPSKALLWTSQDGRSWSELSGGEPFDLGEPGGPSLATVTGLGSRFVVGGQVGDVPAIWISGSGNQR